MKRVSFITLFPDMISQALSWGLVGQALQHNIFMADYTNPREFAEDLHRSVDDRPYGGGDGMVMLCEPLVKSIAKIRTQEARVIYLSPQGRPLSSEKAKELAKIEHLILVSGRYGGIDQRVINRHIDEEISIGDYVLTGGELAACVLVDAVARFIPGVLGHCDSAESDSFVNGGLEAPSFTRPRSYQEDSVPEILLSGNHKLISEWKTRVSQIVTMMKRPDLLKRESIDAKEKEILLKFWRGISAKDREVLGLTRFSLESYLMN